MTDDYTDHSAVEAPVNGGQQVAPYVRVVAVLGSRRGFLNDWKLRRIFCCYWDLTFAPTTSLVDRSRNL